MLIGIDASRAFQKNKTGIEEYSYQAIKHLREFLNEEKVILYCNPAVNVQPDFKLPENWKIKNLRASIFWTQARMSLEMLLHPVDVLFVPAHTVPLIHPKKTVVTIHGLEYEFCPGAYSSFDKLYMRWSIRKSCRWAKKIIAVSKNTKEDLARLYGVPRGKTSIIYEGYVGSENFKLNSNGRINNYKKYFLFVGRLEERKNVAGIVEAFEILKRKYEISHKLILVGKYGHGGIKIKERVYGSRFKSDIILTGYVTDEEKFYLMSNADAFLFPTFYEGFGIPILEAQSVGTPVVTSDISSMPEIAGDGAVLVDPENPDAIAEGIYKLISDREFKNGIIEKGYGNIKRFSWQKCAREISVLLRD